jgi:transposase
MAVRGLGCPVRFTLTAGQKGDAPQAAALIEGLPAEVVMADTAYDADHLRQAIAVIPSNPSRALKYPLDKHLYAQRHLVECCFSKLKQFRRVATRFEKTARNYRAVSLSQPSFYGCDKCPHHLELVLRCLASAGTPISSVSWPGAATRLGPTTTSSGCSKQRDDPDVTAATMAMPGVVLKRVPPGPQGCRLPNDLPTKAGWRQKPSAPLEKGWGGSLLFLRMGEEKRHRERA